MLLTTSTCFFAAAATRIDGRMEVSWPAASPPTTRHYDFSCVVQQNGWRIVTRRDDDQTLGHRELAKDGTNLFLVQYVTSPMTTNKSVVKAQGKVYRDDENAIPYFSEDFAHVLWLAYCRQLKSSSEFHDTEISSRIVYGNNMPPTNFPCTATWNLNDGSALEKLYVSHPGVVFGKSRSYPLSGPLADGYLAGQFETAGLTNAGKAIFPQSVSSSFFAATTTDATALKTIHHVEVRATSISSVSDDVDIRPKVSVLMSVDDYRFVALTGKGATYLATNGWWSPTEKRFTDYSSILKRANAQQKLTPLNRKLAIFAFVVVVLLPGLIIFLRSKKGSRVGANPGTQNST